MLRERDEELMSCYRRVMARPAVIGYLDVYTEVANSPASRFYVDVKRATDVVRGLISGKKDVRLTPLKAEMYGEIARRVAIVMDAHPCLGLREAVERVVESPAPKFYIRPCSVMGIVKRKKRECMADALRRFLFKKRGQEDGGA